MMVDAASLVPSPGIGTTPWGWIEGLMLLMFVGHVLFMNVALGTGIILLVQSFRKAGPYGPISRDISRKLPTALALAVNFGVAPLLFMQYLYGHFFYVSDILLGWWWLAVVALVILAYYTAYLYDFQFEKLGNKGVWSLLFFVLLMLLVSFIFSNNITLMMTPEAWVTRLEQGVTNALNLTEPSLIPRWTHVLVGTMAVGGLSVAVFHRFHKQPESAEAKAGVDLGMKWFFRASLVQLLVGPIFLLTLPSAIWKMFLGGSVFHTVVFGLALVSVIGVLIMGAKRNVRGSVAGVVVTICFMAGMRELVRQAFLAPFYHPSDIPVQPQYSPMILFFIALVISLAIMGHVLKWAWETRTSGAITETGEEG